jgi:Flp pilus assembly protein TadB
MADTRLASEKVVVAAPLSFAGSAGRIWPLTMKSEIGWQKALLVVAALLLIVMAWTFVTFWYVVFGLLLVPYRMIRRGQRKRKVTSLQHREMLAAVQVPAAAIQGAHMQVAPQLASPPAPGQLGPGTGSQLPPATP